MATTSSLSDPELITAVRNGEISAFAGLYGRHADAAYRLARLLSQDVDEAQRLVSASFSRVRAALLGDGGPTVIFRTYLLTTMRAMETEPASTERVIGLLDAIALPPPTDSLAAQALTHLPARWQLVLWHLDVEREPPAVVGPMLGLVPGEVGKLAIRARERLRAAYLREMDERAATEECSWAAHHPGAHAVPDRDDADRERLDRHLADCQRCDRISTEYEQLGTALPELLATLVLGPRAAAYRAAGGAPPDKPPGPPATSQRRSGRDLRRPAVVWAVAAGAAVVVVLAGFQLGSAVRAQQTSLAVPQAVANTPQPAPGRTPGSDGPAAADVAVSLTGTLPRGRNTRLRVEVTNRGAEPSGTVTMVVTLPAGVSLRGTLAGRWDCSGRTTTLVCSHPSLTAGRTVDAAVAVSIESTAPLGGRATAVVSPSARDAASGNNRASTPAGVQARR